MKCRFTVRRFKDTFQELEPYVGTTSRANQRTINTIVAEHDDFVLFSLDVSQALRKAWHSNN